jgi:transketolase
MTYEEKLLELAEQDERIVVMTAENRAAIRNLPQALGDRFIDVGIAEMTMVGAASGLALRGRIPILHALGTFLTLRAYEFIRSDVGIGNLPVILVGGVPGFLSDGNGPTHQAIEDIALMRGILNMGVFCPADGEELVEALPHLIESGKPFYIRFYNGAQVREHQMPFEIGKAEAYPSNAEPDEADDVTILTYGFLLKEALHAQEILEEEGFSVRVINMRTLSPVDEEMIFDAAERSQLLVTLEDHFLTGGLYTIISELFTRDEMIADVMPIALKTWFKPALLNDILEYEGFTAEQIAEKIKDRFEDESDEFDILSREFYTLN